jgi:3-oxoadipate enol-lactonase
VNFHSFGDRGNPPLILLHGIGAGHRLWLRQIEHFRGSHFVIAPDLPGFTGRTDVKRPDIADIAGRLAQELAARALGPVALCGISAGASVALAAAARMGSGVSRLIVSAPQARPPRFMLGLQILISALMPEAALAAIGRSAVRDDAEIAAAAAEDIGALGKSGLLAAMRALQRMDLRAELPGITAPTWVFCGERDRVNLPAARAIAAQLGGARLWIAPDAGHLWNVEAPARFNEALADALRGDGHVGLSAAGTHSVPPKIN